MLEQLVCSRLTVLTVYLWNGSNSRSFPSSGDNSGVWRGLKEKLKEATKLISTKLKSPATYAIRAWAFVYLNPLKIIMITYDRNVTF